MKGNHDTAVSQGPRAPPMFGQITEFGSFENFFDFGGPQKTFLTSKNLPTLGPCDVEMKPVPNSMLLIKF